MKDYRNSAEAQLYHQEVTLREVEERLALSKALPEMSAGYYSETVVDQRFKGFRVGLSLPLWENANTVKKAKSETLLAKKEAERYDFLTENEVMRSLDRLESLDVMVRELEDALSESNDEMLLYMALEAGEISFSEYFYGSEVYFLNIQTLLELKRERLFLIADLVVIYL